METVQVSCKGCLVESGVVGARGAILKTKYFDIHQDCETPIPGFLIISTRRHILSIAEFSEAEMEEFSRLVKVTVEGMKTALGIKDVYLFQNEDSKHHFHLWLFPRLDWMNNFGKKIQSVRPIMDYAAKELNTPAQWNVVDKAVQKMRSYLTCRKYQNLYSKQSN